jgi:hypothetical protein
MQVADVETVRAVRHELSRHMLDISEASVHAGHGIVHLNGRVRPMRGHEAEFSEEIHKLERILRQKTGVREVILDWVAEGYEPGATSKTRSR